MNNTDEEEAPQLPQVDPQSQPAAPPPPPPPPTDIAGYQAMVNTLASANQNLVARADALEAQLAALQAQGHAATDAVHQAAAAGAPAATLLGAQAPPPPPPPDFPSTFKASPPKPFDGKQSSRLIPEISAQEFLGQAERYFYLTGVSELMWTFLILSFLTNGAYIWYTNTITDPKSTPWATFKAAMLYKYTPVNVGKAARAP